MKSRYRVGRVVLAVVAALALSVGVQAHAKLEKSIPAAGATVTAAPAAIMLYFNETPDLKVSKVEVTGPSGKWNSVPHTAWRTRTSWPPSKAPWATASTPSPGKRPAPMVMSRRASFRSPSRRLSKRQERVRGKREHAPGLNTIEASRSRRAAEAPLDRLPPFAAAGALEPPVKSSVGTTA